MPGRWRVDGELGERHPRSAFQNEVTAWSVYPPDLDGGPPVTDRLVRDSVLAELLLVPPGGVLDGKKRQWGLPLPHRIEGQTIQDGVPRHTYGKVPKSFARNSKIA